MKKCLNDAKIDHKFNESMYSTNFSNLKTNLKQS